MQLPEALIMSVDFNPGVQCSVLTLSEAEKGIYAHG